MQVIPINYFISIYFIIIVLKKCFKKVPQMYFEDSFYFNFQYFQKSMKEINNVQEEVLIKICFLLKID